MMASKFLFFHLPHQTIAKLLTTQRYYLRTWGHKFDTKTNHYRLELILERVSEQTSTNIFREIPGPSQMDDWYLYLSIIRRGILTTEATLPVDAAESEWRAEISEILKKIKDTRNNEDTEGMSM
jgi:hypothetical protein